MAPTRLNAQTEENVDNDDDATSDSDTDDNGVFCCCSYFFQFSGAFFMLSTRHTIITFYTIIMMAVYIQTMRYRHVSGFRLRYLTSHFLRLLSNTHSHIFYSRPSASRWRRSRRALCWGKLSRFPYPPQRQQQQQQWKVEKKLCFWDVYEHYGYGYYTHTPTISQPPRTTTPPRIKPCTYE